MLQAHADRLRTMLARPAHAGSRMPGLDALRGIAALLVVLYHYSLGYNGVVAPHTTPLLMVFPFPAIGVQIFFAISGFVIFMTLERCARGRDFAMSRFARLYPPFLFCMLLTAAVTFVFQFNPRGITGADVAANLPMIVGLLDGVYVDPSYWTLTCEICFYALIALVYYQLQQRFFPGRDSFEPRGFNVLLAATLAWMVICVLGRTYGGGDMYAREALALNFQYGHLFVTGIAIYGLVKGRLLVPLSLLAIAALLGAMPVLGALSIGSVVKTLAIAFMIWVGARIPLNGWLASVAFFLGGISYSLYLIHQMIGFLMIARMEQAGLNANLALLLALAAIMLMAYAIRMYVEIPSQNAILKWYRGRKAAPAKLSPNNIA